jgi:hypothetical protein
MRSYSSFRRISSLVLKHAVASLEPRELLTLVGNQPLAVRLVDLRLGDPV